MDRMLKRLRIDNFALIEKLDVEFAPGLNVLTGETGAGKSILLDALDAALGGTVSNKSIRSGAKKALIEAVFAPTPAVLQWLEEQAIDPLEEGIVSSREIGERTSRSRVNGVLVNKLQMQGLRACLIEITAQGQTLQLQDPQNQRRWLDEFAGEETLQVRQQVQEAHRQWMAARTALETSKRDQQTRLQRLDMLQFQAQELGALRLESPDELESLERERDRLSHSVDLQKQSYEIYQLLYQTEGERPTAADLVGEAERILKGMVDLDPELQAVAEMISSALIQVEEAARLLYDYGEGLEANPTRLSKIERRITQLRQICRKYGPSLAEVIAHAERVTEELDFLKDQGASLEDLEEQEKATRTLLEQHCTQLTYLRRQAATQLEAHLIRELEPLGMQGVRFQVQISSGPLSAEGHDQISYWISPNPGEPLQPLAATASGGEMSRFLLAMKAVFTRVDPVAALVFDEIDAGVSGKMAQAIAHKLLTIAHDHQILCVTHQPLIAAMADHHIRVSKAVKQKRTRVQVDTLSEQDRRHELAQLTAGHSAQDALGLVESLLSQAAQLRSRPMVSK
jgi:DNA repair protein RecN (Recombination protein N)